MENRWSFIFRSDQKNLIQSHGSYCSPIWKQIWDINGLIILSLLYSGCLFLHFVVSPWIWNAWVVCPFKAPSRPPCSSRRRSSVNELSATINPFPAQKSDLFIRLSITFYPPWNSALCGSKAAVWLVQGDPLHRNEHSWEEKPRREV